MFIIKEKEHTISVYIIILKYYFYKKNFLNEDLQYAKKINVKMKIINMTILDYNDKFYFIF